MKKVVDPSTGVAFVQLPGGSLEIGLRAKERVLVDTLLGSDPPKIRWPRARKLKVKPFLVSTAALSPEVVGPIVSSYETYGSDAAHVSAQDAVKILAELGYRLLTEAEWEYVARSGGTGSWAANPGRRAGSGAYKRNAFGVSNLGFGTWLAPAKGKLPTIVAAGGLRSFPWQSPGEEISVHVAFRDKTHDAPLLVAWDGKSRAKPKAPVETWNGSLHVPTQLRFVDVPGGSFEMGLTAAERARIEKALPAEHHAAFAEVAANCKPRKATVKPFRVATTPISHEISKRLGGTTDMMFGFACNPMKTVEKWAKKFGFRLLTEAEWEYLARDGGERGWGADLEVLLARLSDPTKKAPAYTNRFGVEALHAGSYVDDGFLVRSTIWRDFGYPDEIGDYIPKIYRRRTGDHGWAPILFAIAQ